MLGIGMSKDLKELLMSLAIIVVFYLIIWAINHYCAKRIRENKINRLLISRATMRTVVGKAARVQAASEEKMLKNLEYIARSMFGTEVRYLLTSIRYSKETNDLEAMGVYQARLDALAIKIMAGRDEAMAKMDAAYEANVAEPKKRLKEIEEELKELEYDPSKK